MKLNEQEIHALAIEFKDLEDAYCNAKDKNEQAHFEHEITKLTESLFAYENAIEAMLEIDELITNSQ